MMNSSSTASMNTSIESDINILNVLYRQIIIDLSQNLKDPQNAQLSEHAKVRIKSFEVLIETIQSRIQHSKDVIQRDINKANDESLDLFGDPY